jgi:hypothetical protein
LAELPGYATGQCRFAADCPGPGEEDPGKGQIEEIKAGVLADSEGEVGCHSREAWIGLALSGDTGGFFCDFAGFGAIDRLFLFSGLVYPVSENGLRA